MKTARLCDIRVCLDGFIPATMATCAADGTPNVAYISQVFYVDERHVALSFQFFNKTRQNILANPYATVMLIDPRTGGMYRLQLRYLRTETEGALFESMKAQLAGIASHTGMAGVFRLLGSDVYEVEHVEALEGPPVPEMPERAGLLGVARRCSERLARCTSLDEALNAVLATMTDFMGVEHGMILMIDNASHRLYTVASCGYSTSGVGSEIGLGEGVIGVAAREGTPVRINHMTSAYLYSVAMRGAGGEAAGMEIPYPGLAQPHSQLAVPVMSAGRVLGAIFVESERDMQFGHEDEDLLVAMAGHLGAAIDLMQASTDAPESAAPAQAAAPASGAPLQVKHFASNDSVFIDDTYLIKGVAGAILWKLLREFTKGRREFSNRELRLDATLGLPDVGDNLEARLVLLRRRLAEHGPHLRIEKTGRGLFKLVVQRPVELLDA